VAAWSGGEGGGVEVRAVERRRARRLGSEARAVERRRGQWSGGRNGAWPVIIGEEEGRQLRGEEEGRQLSSSSGKKRGGGVGEGEGRRHCLARVSAGGSSEARGEKAGGETVLP
jgi:hypothetical protein